MTVPTHDQEIDCVFVDKGFENLADGTSLDPDCVQLSFDAVFRQMTS